MRGHLLSLILSANCIIISSVTFSSKIFFIHPFLLNPNDIQTSSWQNVAPWWNLSGGVALHRTLFQYIIYELCQENLNKSNKILKGDGNIESTCSLQLNTKRSLWMAIWVALNIIHLHTNITLGVSFWCIVLVIMGYIIWCCMSSKTW